VKTLLKICTPDIRISIRISDVYKTDIKKLGMFIQEGGRVPTRKLAQLIRRKSHFTFAFSGLS